MRSATDPHTAEVGLLLRQGFERDAARRAALRRLVDAKGIGGVVEDLALIAREIAREIADGTTGDMGGQLVGLQTSRAYLALARGLNQLTTTRRAE